MTIRLAVLALAFAMGRAQSQSDGEVLIEKARKAAEAYASSLPDYIVKRTTTRLVGYLSQHHFPPGSITLWRTLDVLSAEVAVVEHKEVYSDLTRNGKPVGALPSGGAWSIGEFSTELLAIFPVERAATFTHPHEESIRNHASTRYDFVVDQAHSVWNLSAGDLPGAPGMVRLSPGYGGQIWIDKSSGQTLRIVKSARELPGYFPLERVQSVTDYGFVKIGDGSYLLPTRSETVSCQRDRVICLKNGTVFKDYDKFGSNTSISFAPTLK